MVRMYYVLVTGSGELSSHLVEFTRVLGKRIMEEKDLVLVTGGLKQIKEGISTADYEVVRGALEGLADSGGDPAQRILTIVPENEYDKARRFDEGKVESVRYSNVRSRRFAMVFRSDAVIAIEGHKATRENIDLAWTLGKPLLPVPCTGGNSRDAWQQYGEELTKTFRMTENEVRVLESGLSDAGQLADLCITILRRKVRPRCFVAMKFDHHPALWAYDVIARSAEERHFLPVRVDKLTSVASIVDTIWEGIRSSDKLVADVSGNSPNVFYELGIAHALRKDTIILLYNSSGKLPEDVPFDIKVHRVMVYQSPESLRALLDREL